MIAPMIGLVDIKDNGSEVEAIRQAIEYYGFQTITYRVGRPNNLVDILSGRNRLSLLSSLIICGHGKDGQLLLPKLSQEIYEDDEPRKNFGSASFEQYAHFRRELVITTACTLGNQQVANSILQKGAIGFIGPTGYVEGNAALAFVNFFFYEFSKGLGTNKAFQKASGIDKFTALFSHFEHIK